MTSHPAVFIPGSKQDEAAAGSAFPVERRGEGLTIDLESPSPPVPSLIDRMAWAIRGLDNAALGPEKSLRWRRHAYEVHQLAIDPEDFERLDRAAMERNGTAS